RCRKGAKGKGLRGLSHKTPLCYLFDSPINNVRKWLKNIEESASRGPCSPPCTGTQTCAKRWLEAPGPRPHEGDGCRAEGDRQAHETHDALPCQHPGHGRRGANFTEGFAKVPHSSIILWRFARHENPLTVFRPRVTMNLFTLD